jgi:hypothetical protein
VSPDESEVAFLSDNGGHANVWAARIADGEMRPITREFDPRVVIAVPLWSPRGDFINFLSNRKSLGTEVTLWVVKPDGTEPRDLGIVGSGVCWSRDGRWLYYLDGNKDTSHIYKLGVDGGNPALIRSDNAWGPSIAADGALYYSRMLTQATGAWDHEIRVARPETGLSRVLAGFGSTHSGRSHQFLSICLARWQMARHATNRWSDHQFMGVVHGRRRRGPHLCRYRWPPGRSRFPTPESPERSSMPPDQRGWFDDDQGAAPVEEPGELGQHESIRSCCWRGFFLALLE